MSQDLRRSIEPVPGYEPLPDESIETPVATSVECQVERTPHRPAVSTANVSLSYRELNESSNQLAHALLEKLGSGSEPVATVLDHGPELIIAMLAVAKAGKATLVVDPTLSVERIDYLRSDSGFRAAIAEPAYAGKLRQNELVQILEDRSRQPADNPEVEVAPDTPAGLIYTSGSTGKPKAVVRPHSSLMASIQMFSQATRLTPDDRLSIVQAVAAGTLQGTVFGALVRGCCLVPFDLRREGFRRLARCLRDENVTLFSCVASVFRRFCASLTAGQEFPHLRNIRIGGETVVPSDLRLFQKHFRPPCSLRIGMGASECGEIASWFLYPDDEIPEGRVPVGYPRPGVEVSIENENRELLPAGAIGEIVVRSPGVTSGYWGRRELTDEKFDPDPEGGRRRSYRTGDLGRLRKDGLLEHHGRTDLQVQIMGNRVEPAEVEAALLELPEVAEAVVAIRQTAGSEQRLAAFLVSASDEPPTTSRLRRKLSSRLSDAMMPSHFVFLPSLPRTATGKLDRNTLPELDGHRPRLDAEFCEPRSAVERVLAGLFSDLLGVRPIGVHDNFFELGGSSLRAVQLAARIWDVFNREVAVSDFFERPTVVRVAAILTADPLLAEQIVRRAELQLKVNAMSDQQVAQALEGLEAESRN